MKTSSLNNKSKGAGEVKNGSARAKIAHFVAMVNYTGLEGISTGIDGKTHVLKSNIGSLANLG